MIVAVGASMSVLKPTKMLALCMAAAQLYICMGVPDPQSPDTFTVNFKTDIGTFDVQVFRTWAPKGADRLYNLVQRGYFTNSRFFRAVPDFMVQFGISGDPKLNQEWKDAVIEDDAPNGQSNAKGMVTFAHAGAGTRSAQMFINTKDNKYLDSMNFPPIGKVVRGMEVVEKFNTKYGEATMDHNQEMLDQGNAYLDQQFPGLSQILNVSIVSAPEDRAPPAAALGASGVTAAANLLNLIQNQPDPNSASKPAAAEQLMKLLQGAVKSAAKPATLSPGVAAVDQMTQLAQISAASKPLHPDMVPVHQHAPEGVDVVELARQWGNMQAKKKAEESSGGGLLNNMMSNFLGGGQQQQQKHGGMEALTGVLSSMAGGQSSGAANPLASMASAFMGGGNQGGGGMPGAADMMQMLGGMGGL